ncbi:hypothetical protein [Rhodohalobacter sp. 8-1]|uniref:hypothetical protein n=1 Tax=Rhodohalobacter sp. 8-1 TaxID=3131972 RepID=UPI0030EF65BB
MKTNPITGILWWKPDQWEKAKQISSDSHIFDNTYQEWKESAEKSFNELRGNGFTVYKIEIDLDELVKWCKDKEMALNAQARSQFVSNKVKKLHEANYN